MAAKEPLRVVLEDDLKGADSLGWYQEALSAIRKKRPLEIDFASVNRISNLHLIHLADLEAHATHKKKNVTIENMSAEIGDRYRELCEYRKDVFKRPDHANMFLYLGDLVTLLYQQVLSFLALASDVFFRSIQYLFSSRTRPPGSVQTQMLLLGINAFPIISVLIFLIGMVISLQSADQLRQFGANIYIVDLVVLAMSREMGPLITAVIIAGRSGASIAAEIATMRVNEEIDALQTMGIDPVSYIILPKTYGLIFTLPLLTLFADHIGIAGGMLIALLSLDITPLSFVNRSLEVASIFDFSTGLIRSFVFAWIIVLVSSWFGMNARGGAEGVGRSTTSSVVASIFLIIVADAILGLMFYL